MIINYDSDKIERAVKDFYNATGVDMELLRLDLTAACSGGRCNVEYCRAAQRTQEGRRACLESDKELLLRCKESGRAERSLCHAGLINVAIPLIYGETVIGYIIFGRIRPEGKIGISRDYAERLGLDLDKMESLYADIPTLDEERIESVSSIAIMLAKYILLENMLHPDRNGGTARAAEYINAHLSEELTSDVIARQANMSKSSLYKRFRAEFGCTPGEYLNTKRIERSVELMDEDMSIEEISRAVGFSSAAYYSRTFKEKMGTSPKKFKLLRKNSRQST